MNRKGIKKLYVASEMMKAGVWGPMIKKDDLDEVHITFASPEGGCFWEFSIALRLLSDNHAAFLLKMYGDSWMALGEAPEVFKVVQQFASKSQEDNREAWPKLIQALEKVGWNREKPEPRELPTPVICSKCGRA